MKRNCVDAQALKNKDDILPGLKPGVSNRTDVTATIKYRPDFTADDFSDSSLFGIRVSKQKKLIELELYYIKPNLLEVEVVVDGKTYRNKDLEQRRAVLRFKEVKKYHTDIQNIPYAGYYETGPIEESVLPNGDRRFLMRLYPATDLAFDDWHERRRGIAYVELEMYLDIIAEDAEVEFFEFMDNVRTIFAKQKIWSPKAGYMYFDESFDEKAGFKEEDWKK